MNRRNQLIQLETNFEKIAQCNCSVSYLLWFLFFMQSIMSYSSVKFIACDKATHRRTKPTCRFLVFVFFDATIAGTLYGHAIIRANNDFFFLNKNVYVQFSLIMPSILGLSPASG